MDVTERISRLLEEKFATDEAFADCFMVEIELKGGQHLNVFADSDSGMTFEKCQGLSRYLEKYLDENGWLGEKYVLEVSSPGVGRPLKFPRQYRKNTGRKLAVTLTDKSLKTGVLKSADDNGIVLETTHIERENNKKKEIKTDIPITYDQIEKAVVQLEF